MINSKKKVTFLLDAEAVKLSKVLSKDFLEIEIYAISEGENRNDYDFLLEAMKKSLPSFGGKPVLAYFNPVTGGIEEHNATISRDRDTGEEFYDYTSYNSERSVGFLTPSTAEIVEYMNKKWIKVKANLWVKYNRQLIKNLLKAQSRKVSVEIEILKSHEGEEGREIIEEFSLDGITILQYRPNTTIPIPEGIEGAKLNLKEFANSVNFATFKREMRCAFAQQGLERNEGTKELNYAKKERIEIDNSKEAAIFDKDWVKPDAEFYDWLREASNFRSLSKENALVLEEGWETNIASNKYPHHSRKDGKLVVNERGVRAAYSRGMAQNLFEENPSAKRHILKHFKELELPTKDMFTRDIFAEIQMPNKEKKVVGHFAKNDIKVLDFVVESLEDNFIEREGNLKMFNEKKGELLRKFLSEHYCAIMEGEDRECYVYICDMNDEEVIYYLNMGEETAHYRAHYSIEETEEEIKVFVDVENAVMVGTAWEDYDKAIVFEDVEYSRDEFIEKHSAVCADFAKKSEEFDELNAKFTELEKQNSQLSEANETLKFSLEEAENKINQFNLENEERTLADMRCEACKMIDEEDFLDSEEDKKAKEALKALVEQYCGEKKFESKEEMCNFVSTELSKLVYAKVKSAKEDKKEKKEEFNAELNRELSKQPEGPKDCFSVLREYNNR